MSDKEIGGKRDVKYNGVDQDHVQHETFALNFPFSPHS
jgi:hypothetical protein